jgi:hypothetical protein
MTTDSGEVKMANVGLALVLLPLICVAVVALIAWWRA